MPPEPAATLPVVINCEAGSALGSDPAALARRVEQGFRDGGVTIRLRLVSGRLLAGAIRQEMAARPARLIVGGGDGSVATAAAELAGTQTALGILPLGTVNILARDLGLPLELDRAIATLAAAPARRIDVGEINGRVFVNRVALGVLPTLARLREDVRHRAGLWKWVPFVWRCARALLGHRRLGLKLTMGGRTSLVRTLTLLIGNNPFSETGLMTRPRLDGGVLAIYVSRHRSPARLVLAFLRALRGAWRNDPEVAVGLAATVLIESRRRLLAVMLDGEPHRLLAPLRCRIRPAALSVLAPAP